MKRTAIYLLGAVCALPFGVAFAADSAPTSSTSALSPAVSEQAVAAPVGAVKLPYGVEDVLKLSRAQISDDIILYYIQGSGTIYNLTPKEIVYLHDQGVSEKVITAMLNQRKAAAVAMQPAASQQTGVPATSVPNTPTVTNAPVVADASVAQPAPTYTENSPTYATAPLTPPASTTYVIPYNYSYYSPYYYDPYWYGGWYGPSIVVGIGGRGYYGHHYWGGHYGGGHWGGSVAHGGGGHGGHR